MNFGYKRRALAAFGCERPVVAVHWKNSAWSSYRTFPQADSFRGTSPVNKTIQLNREASMKTTVFAALLFASTLTAGTAVAQPAPFNDVGLTMGHWHLISKDVEANKKIFLAMSGKLFMVGGNPIMMFPGVYINLNLGTEKGEGGSQGSVVNHVGFIVNNVQERAAQWKLLGVPVLPGTNNRPDQAFVETPDGVRIEILEDKTQSMPIRHEHVHFWLTEAEIPKAQAWYAKTFGGKAGTRNDAPVVDIPGGQFRFAKADQAQVPTRGRVLDHFGVDVKDLHAAIARLEGLGIKLDEPYRKGPTGNAVTYITDPWGARIELVERAPL
jgi:catechol 2,3-dioxygenase-like lactoylglutathione lyase family enzyme